MTKRDSNSKINTMLIMILMAVGVCINYIDRVNISNCVVVLSKEMHIDAYYQGIILSGFSVGYVIAMVFGGILVDRIGAIQIVSFSMILWSITTALTGLISNVPMLIICRIATGIFEAPLFPANAKIVREYLPIEDRGRATAIFDSGSYVGTAVAAPLVIYSTLVFNWRIAFFICAFFGLLWLPFWKHNTTQLKQILNNRTHTNVDLHQIKRFISHRTILGMSLGFFCYNYIKSFYLTWLPAYLVKDRGFSLFSVGYLAMLPPLSAITGCLFSGWLTDWLIRRGFPVTIAHKYPLCVSLILASLVCLVVFAHSESTIMIILCFSFASTIAASPCIWLLPGDVAPDSASVGTIGGIQNTFSNIAGIIAPTVTGFIVYTTGVFNLALILSSFIAIIGALSYGFIVGPLYPIEDKV